ncbi:MAG: protein-L-isoaspartate O-methyltransferase [Methylobacterium organophilum]|nr:protein-L-isoaspartate O-methyltransferase [Methylobacterium organophilum]
MPDFEALRMTMVDTQVRPNDVTKFPVIEAMLAVPKEVFVPPSLQGAAYVGENVEIAPGRVVLEARTLAKMLDALDVGPADRVLDVGSGLGYSAAVIARMAASVVALEEEGTLAAEARRVLGGLGAANITLRTGPLTGGAPDLGPFDVITIEGAAEVIPEALVSQLAEGGRIGCLFQEGAVGVCRIGVMSEGRVSWRPVFNAGAPVLPGFEARRGFVL